MKVRQGHKVEAQKYQIAYIPKTSSSTGNTLCHKASFLHYK